MKYDRDNPGAGRAGTGAMPQTRAAAGGGGAGFSMIELMVVIVILGILTAAVAANWATFARHQQVRESALGLHKEIMALKAQMLDNDDTAKIVYESGTTVSACTLKIRDITKTPNWSSKPIKFNGGVVFNTETINAGANGLPAAGTNNWSGRTIAAIPGPNKNIDAFQTGWVVLSTGSGANMSSYCIIKPTDGIKPEIYHRKGTGSWKKI